MPIQHWPIAVIAIFAAFLLFTNLGRDYLWADEGDTAVFAQTILDHGVPMGWDGRTFHDIDYGKRLNDDFVMVGHPWAQYYAGAASMAVFGESAFAARLPFALAGLATIVLVYVLVWRATGHRGAAATAALLLTLSVQFLLYSRQSRHYSLNALLTLLVVMQFTRLRSTGTMIGFALLGVLLFHTHPLGLVPLVALGILTFIYRPVFDRRRWVLMAAPIVAVLTVPWMFAASAGYSETTAPLRDIEVLLPRMGQYLVEVGSVTPLLGIAVLAWVARRRARRAPPVTSTATAARRSGSGRSKLASPAVRAALFSPAERDLLVTIVMTTLMYAVAMAVTLSRDSIWQFGTRYTSAMLPFGAIAAALVVYRFAGANWRIWLACVLILGFTKLARVTPYTFWQDPTPIREMDAAITFHAPPDFIDRVLRTGQVEFVQSLFTHDIGTQGQIIEFLRDHAGPDDIVVTNYGWEPLYFHTQLRQGMKILPSWPVYGAARAKNLPEYVFTAEGARWIVWRRAWGPYVGHDLGGLLDDLDRAGVPLTRVAEIPETMWENRENVHFHRFPEDDYIYSWYAKLPDAVIFRVGQ